MRARTLMVVLLLAPAFAACNNLTSFKRSTPLHFDAAGEADAAGEPKQSADAIAVGAVGASERAADQARIAGRRAAGSASVTEDKGAADQPRPAGSPFAPFSVHRNARMLHGSALA